MRYGRLVKETLAGHPVELVDLAGINEEAVSYTHLTLRSQAQSDTGSTQTASVALCLLLLLRNETVYGMIFLGLHSEIALANCVASMLHWLFEYTFS